MHRSGPHCRERRSEAKASAVPCRLALAGEDLDAATAAGSSRLLTVRFAGACSKASAGPGSPKRTGSSGAGAGAAATESPLALVGNRVLGASSPVETWLSELAVHRGSLGGVEWAENGSVLFGSLASRPQGNLSRETEAHFSALLAAIEGRGYPHLLRVWNFLPGINAAEGGTERYRLFNCGRAAAFDARYGVCGAEARFSASSAVGSTGDWLVTFFAAAHSPGLHLGNPRQVHAFRYPTDYGPRPPSFSRATISPPELGRILFLSGTASITGHETRHAGELQLQLQETLDNIETLLASASPGGAAATARGDGAPAAGETRLPALEEFDLFRVYLRAASDYASVRAALRHRVGPGPALSFVEADICRADLLLEIEGVAGLQR